MARRACLVVLSFSLGALGWPARLPAQVAPVVCPCGEARDLGSCVVATPLSIPTTFGEFPGSALVVRATVNAQEVNYLYLADLFSGFTLRFNLKPSNGLLTPSVQRAVGASPRASAETSGLAYNPLDGLLYWAIEGRLLTSNLDLGDVKDVAPVDLAGLKTRLDLPLTPRLGGIAFHDVRQFFWGVDIVNDVYFEFTDVGSLVEEDGQPVHFRNPLRGSYGGGAYGNSIAYVFAGSQSYFDLPVGSLTDAGVKQVWRVHAAAGGEGAEAHRIGDPVGLLYDIEKGAGSHGFISGIGYFPDTCGAGNHTEFLLSIGSQANGTPSRIYQVSVDDPQTTTLSRFEGTSEANSVRLTWTAPASYATLQISRRLLPAGTPQPVTTFSNHAQDPREYLDRNLGDGIYEYIARVTPAAPSRAVLPDLKIKVVVGLGSVVAHGSFLLAARPADQEPFAMTHVASADRLLVVDRKTGVGHIYRTDLTSDGFIAGPFTGDAGSGGLTTGVAWLPASNKLAWILESSGGSFIQVTSLPGVPEGTRRPIDVPFNIRRTPRIGDIAFDPARNEFWGIDRVNMLAYSFNAGGDLTGQSATLQLPAPRAPDGEFGGGLALVESTGSKLTLDYVTGRVAAGGPGELARVSYNRTGAAGDGFTLPGSESATLDLRTILQSLEPGGLVALTLDGDDFVYVVGVDTQTIYKLRMESGLEGEEFKRGEVNNDGGPPNISDAIAILIHLFRGGPRLPCEDAADLNDDEKLDITDPVLLFSYLFKRGAPPPAPFTSCGRDFDPPLICEEANCT